jgi:CMP/dCMP kinase
MFETKLVTIDGKRGTGKSRLARELRDHFGCGVLEIGPIFRILAWMVESGHAKAADDACKSLVHWLTTGRLRIDMNSGGQLSSCQILIDGITMETELWSSKLDPILSGIAATEKAISCVANFARLLIQDKSTIIIGRETGSVMFPEAKTKILLKANDEVRQRRKLTQLEGEIHEVSATYNVQDSEPARRWTEEGYNLTLDTTHTTPEAILNLAASYLARTLGWTKNESL